MTHPIENPEFHALIEQIESFGLGWKIAYDVDARCYTAEMWWWENGEVRRVQSGVCCETIVSALRRNLVKVPEGAKI